MIAIVGRPTPTPTAMAIMSLVLRPEPELRLEVGFVLLDVEVGEVLPVGLLPALVPLLLPPLPPPLLLLLLGVPVLVGFELPPVLSPVEPVATAANAETIAVVVLLACGLFAEHENMIDLALYTSVPAANWKQFDANMDFDTSLVGTPHPVSW